MKDARERALQKAIEALERVRNGLGGRYYKTKRQVDDRVAVVLSGNRMLYNFGPGGPTFKWFGGGQ